MNKCPPAEHDKEGRVITLEFEDFYMVTVYTPNSQNELARLDYRMAWEDAFCAYLKKLEEVKPVIVCGDMNVAHKIGGIHCYHIKIFKFQCNNTPFFVVLLATDK